MLTRGEMLERFGLPDRATFEIEPQLDPHNVWRIKFAHDGDPAIFLGLGAAQRLAAAIRATDAELGDRIDACVDQAMRNAKRSN